MPEQLAAEVVEKRVLTDVEFDTLSDAEIVSLRDLLRLFENYPGIGKQNAVNLGLYLAKHRSHLVTQ